MITVLQIKKCIGAVFSRGIVSHIIRLLLTVLVLVFVNRSITLHDVTSLFGKIDSIPLFLCFFLGAGIIAAQSLRWSMVMHGFGVKVGFLAALKSLLWGNVLAFVTPGRAGELLRGIDLDPSRKLLMVSASLIDRCFAVIPVILCTIPVLILLHDYIGTTIPLYFIILASAVFFLLILTFFAISFPGTGIWVPGKIAPLIAQVTMSVKNVNLFRTMVLSFVIHGMLIVQTIILFDVFGLGTGSKNCSISILSYTYMLCIPVSIANIGIREYAFGLFAVMAYGNGIGLQNIKVASFGVSSLILMINIITPALLGLVWNLLPSRSENNTMKIYNIAACKEANRNATGKI